MFIVFDFNEVSFRAFVANLTIIPVCKTRLSFLRGKASNSYKTARPANCKLVRQLSPHSMPTTSSISSNRPRRSVTYSGNPAKSDDFMRGTDVIIAARPYKNIAIHQYYVKVPGPLKFYIPSSGSRVRSLSSVSDFVAHTAS